MKIKKIAALPNVKLIVFLHQKGESRYSQLSQLVRSRGALSNAFKELFQEELIQRRIDPKTKPAQSFYSLTRKGRELGVELSKIESILKQD